MEGREVKTRIWGQSCDLLRWLRKFVWCRTKRRMESVSRRKGEKGSGAPRNAQPTGKFPPLTSPRLSVLCYAANLPAILKTVSGFSKSWYFFVNGILKNSALTPLTWSTRRCNSSGISVKPKQHGWSQQRSTEIPTVIALISESPTHANFPIPCKQGFLSSMPFSVHKVVCVACLSRSCVVTSRKKKKKTNKQTNHVSDKLRDRLCKR